MREATGSAKLGENKYYVTSHRRHFVNISSLSLHLLKRSSCQGNADYRATVTQLEGRFVGKAGVLQLFVFPLNRA